MQDHGCGIPAELQGKIFEPFFSTKSNQAGSGMGLGLAVSRSLVESMAGRLDFVSTMGEGTAFHLELPSILPSFSSETRAQAVASPA